MFFLITLGAVLVGFSMALLVIANAFLHKQVDERLDAALNTLGAAADVGPEGVEWEFDERPALMKAAASQENVAWRVSDDRDGTVDSDRQPGTVEMLTNALQTLSSRKQTTARLDWNGVGWQIGHRRLHQTQSTSGELADPIRSDDGLRYSMLTITVGISLKPVHTIVRKLGLSLVGISLAIWLSALVIGHFVSRRALLPVTRMAVAAREMSVDDLGQRLPGSASGDELDDLSGAFNSLLDRLQESFERQRGFTGDASHQLRTPLTAMLGQVEVALRRERPADEYHRVLESVHHSARQLRSIVESLLFLSRADAEAILDNLEVITLTEFLTVYIQNRPKDLRTEDLRFKSGDTGSDKVRAQPVMLAELMNILIDNACKFSEPKTPIDVRIVNEGQSVSIQVEDRGCGIGENDITSVFTPFFRSTAVRQRGIEGTGLGLSIAKRLTEAFGGTLSVTSHVGHGSCFTVTLPLVTRVLRKP